MLSTILIIDKRKELSTKYKKTLENSDVEVILARNLKLAITEVQNYEPDMIIVSDSIEEPLPSFCQKIRALTYNTRPVIIALSKSAETQDRISVLESGADDFLSEPVNIEEFKSRINAHLRRDMESGLDDKTLLPAKKIVKKAVKRAINKENSAILLIGFENLEGYKIGYTELAADKLVQTFIAIAKSALTDTDFIGQYDENNLIIITNKYGAEKLASFLTFAFDTVVSKFYSEKDAQRGYMALKGERYAGMRINFVSVLIGVIMDGLNQINNVDLLIERLFSIKKLAKVPSGSNYMIERTKLSAHDSVVEQIINKNIYIKESDSSLEYLIRTALELQGYDVQNELDTTSTEQPSIIILDCQKDFSELEFLEELKKNNNFVNTKVIVTSTVHDKTTILNSGADLYLPKPYEISDLIRWVEKFIRESM